MSRYRPPQSPGSNYITAEGARRLREELGRLWRVQRPEVTRALGDAAAEGDRSENAEYIYRKKQLRELDRRIRYLSKRLETLVTVDSIPAERTRIYFGAWFRLEDERGGVSSYRIVGPDEFDPKRNWISMDSPLGRAVMRKGEGEEFTVALPKGEASYIVLEVRYAPLEAD